MMIAMDLTVRQSLRVLTEAVKTRAKLEIDPLPELSSGPLWGVVSGRSNDLLTVDLINAGRDGSLRRLVGAMCDVRTILSGQMYMFAAPIVDLAEHSAPVRIVLGAPAAVRVANRRRFARHAPCDPTPIRLHASPAGHPMVGVLTDISRVGLGCRLPRAGVDETLLIGDPVRVEFTLPWTGTLHDLQCEVCTKSAGPEPAELVVGLEFLSHCASDCAAYEMLCGCLDRVNDQLFDEEETR